MRPNYGRQCSEKTEIWKSSETTGKQDSDPRTCATCEHSGFVLQSPTRFLAWIFLIKFFAEYHYSELILFVLTCWMPPRYESQIVVGLTEDLLISIRRQREPQSDFRGCVSDIALMCMIIMAPNVLCLPISVHHLKGSTVCEMFAPTITCNQCNLQLGGVN